MKLFNSLRCDLNKAVINLGFLGAAAVTAILCFTANVYTDMSNDKTYSVFEALFTLDKNIIKTDYSFAAIVVFKKALSGYITMFIPIIVAFPFMVSFCAERNNGLMRFTITRTGKYKYYLSKFFASFISGGLAVLLGVALFGAIIYLIFPNLSTYEIAADELEWIMPNGTFTIIGKMFLSAFLYGSVSTLPAFFLSSFCKNPYLITCVPFMLNYVWSTAINKAVAKGWENGDWDVYERLTPFSPDSITTVSYSTEFTETLKSADFQRRICACSACGIYSRHELQNG
jgi:ABC-type transport system involved in multi-copper enzyme maturation permease subunit